MPAEQTDCGCTFKGLVFNRSLRASKEVLDNRLLAKTIKIKMQQQRLTMTEAQLYALLDACGQKVSNNFQRFVDQCVRKVSARTAALKSMGMMAVAKLSFINEDLLKRY